MSDTETKPRFAVLSDSGVVNHPTLSYYDREVILLGWHPSDPREAAKIDIRVARWENDSFAKVFNRRLGHWSYVTALSTARWWGTMPGYSRANTSEADRRTLRLANDCAAFLAGIVEVADL